MHHQNVEGNNKPISRNRNYPSDLNNLPPLITIAAAAYLTSTSEEFWRKRVREKRIRFSKLGKSVRIPADEFLRIIRNILPIVADKELED